MVLKVNWVNSFERFNEIYSDVILRKANLGIPRAILGAGMDKRWIN